MKKSFGLLVVAMVASMSFAGVALAEDTEESPEGTMLAPVIIVDEETGTITIGLPADGEVPECGPEEPVDPGGDPGDPVDEAVDEGGDPVDEGGDPGDEGADPETYGPGDCIEFVIEHPSGKMHHGAMVSTVAKNLHPSMLEGFKKGHIMRHVAKTGKVDDGGDDDDDDDGGASAALKVKKDKPLKAKVEKVEKDKTNRGQSKTKANRGKHNR